MRSIIVITSIFSPSKAVQAFARKDEFELIVVGDKKTPEDWSCPGAQYFSIDEQTQLAPRLARVLPINHY